MAALKRQTVRVLVVAGIEFAFGGVDFSMNIDRGSREPYLQTQFLLFAPYIGQIQKDNLRKRLNQFGNVEVPVYAKRFDGDHAALAYALKYEFFRRESYLQQAYERADCRDTVNTRSRPLRGQAAAQLAIMLDRLGLNSRIVLVGVKRIRKKGGVHMTLGK